MVKKICGKCGKLKSGKSTKFDKKQLEILRLLKDNAEGLRVNTMLRLLQTTKRTLYRNLNKLQNIGVVINLYPIWKIQALSEKWQTLLKEDNIQNHRFSFVLQLIRKPYWWKNRSGKLMKLKGFNFLNESKWGNTKYQQLFYEHFIIQTFNSSIVIINQRRYWGATAYDCFINSLEETLELVKYIEEFYNFKFTMDGVPHMNIKSHEYVDLKDELARRCKGTKKGFFVEIGGVKRVWVDFSIPFGLEFGSRLDAPDDQAKYKRYVTDIIENDAPLNTELSQDVTDLKGLIKSQQEQIAQLTNTISSMIQQKPEQLNKRDSYFG